MADPSGLLLLLQTAMAAPAPPTLPRVGDRNAICHLENGRFEMDDPANPRPDSVLLGAPSNRPDWHPIIHTYGLRVLNLAGFINGPMPADMNINFRSNEPLHPLVRRDRWLDMQDDATWGLIQPSLQLVSAFLNDPDVLRFFWAFATRPTNVWAPALGAYVKRLDIPPPLDSASYQLVWDMLEDTRSYVHFDVAPRNPVEDGDQGITEPYPVGTVPNHPTKPSDPGYHPRTTSSSVCHIHPGYIDALRRHATGGALQWLEQRQVRDQIDQDRRIPVDTVSAQIRVTFQLAKTIMHELGHAICYAHYQSWNWPNENFPEPFIRDDRVAEVGFAFERHLFGGVIEGISNTLGKDRDVYLEEEMHSLYGFTFQPRRNMWWRDEPATSVRVLVPPPDPNKPLVENLYALQHSYTPELFTPRFWNDSVKRFGCAAIHVQPDQRWGMAWNKLVSLKGDWGTGDWTNMTA